MALSIVWVISYTLSDSLAPARPARIKIQVAAQKQIELIFLGFKIPEY